MSVILLTTSSCMLCCFNFGYMIIVTVILLPTVSQPFICLCLSGVHWPLNSFNDQVEKYYFFFFSQCMVTIFFFSQSSFSYFVCASQFVIQMRILLTFIQVNTQIVHFVIVHNLLIFTTGVFSCLNLQCSAFLALPFSIQLYSSYLLRMFFFQLCCMQSMICCMYIVTNYWWLVYGMWKLWYLFLTVSCSW